VIGEGLQPRLIIDYGVGVDFTKNVVDFGKKYLSIGDKSFPDYKDNIKFVNPDVYPVKWYIKTDHLENDNVFSIRPTTGSIEPNDSCLVRFGFNPSEAKEYDEKIELFLDEAASPYLIISLKGEGSIPRISFDRR